MNAKTTSSSKRKRCWTLISLIAIAAIGFYSKVYSGPSGDWVNNSLSGVFYEIFWCLLVFLLSGYRRPVVIATLVLIITCCLEFLQLWHPSFLEFVRSCFLGRAVLGTSFMWSDFPYYFLGCGVGLIWMRRLQSIDDAESHELHESEDVT